MSKISEHLNRKIVQKNFYIEDDKKLHKDK